MTEHALAAHEANEGSQQVTFWQLAAPVRGRVLFAGVLSALGAVLGLLPVVLAMELVRTILPVLGGQDLAQDRAFAILGLLVASIVVSQLLTMGGYGVATSQMRGWPSTCGSGRSPRL